MKKGKKQPELASLLWPASRLDEAIEILARKSGLLSSDQTEPPRPPDGLDQADDESLERWMDFAAGQLDIEIEPVETPYPQVEQMVCQAGPALIRVPGTDTAQFIVLLKRGRTQISLIAQNLSVLRVAPEFVRNMLTSELEAPLTENIEQLLKRAGVSEERRKHAHDSVLREQLSSARIGGCWLLRLPPGTGFMKQLGYAGLPKYLIIIVALHFVGQGLMLFNWWVIGRGALQGHFEWVWLFAWALILFTEIPFHILGAWVETLLSVGVGSLFKKRLLYGTMRLEPEEIRHQGSGQFLSRIMESEALDAMVLASGFAAVLAVIDIFIAAAVLSKGLGGWLHTIPLFAWMTVTFIICWQYYRYNRQWIETYREMTNDLVERMVGHRTRLAQEDRAHWHEEEDQILNRYLKLSEKTDNLGMQLNAFVNRGWMIVGLAGFAYTFVTAPDSQMELAISMGGIMLASGALTSFAGGIMSIVGAKMAWEQAAPLFQAGTAGKDRPFLSVDPLSVSDKNTDDNIQPLMQLRDIVFRFRIHGKPVLRDCSLKIRKGDRMLLEGPSGGGKSTLASLVAGLRVPESGILLLDGFDRQTIGLDAWRRRVVAAPQFHENHILTETFSFNLLMGRRWPPLQEDIEEAEDICRELGLGGLLERMPAGFQQMVGESGWQLSHGERSRVFIARALLQYADIIILDESFAALDPENLRLALQCVLRRASTLLVIAHP